MEMTMFTNSRSRNLQNDFYVFKKYGLHSTSDLIYKKSISEEPIKWEKWRRRSKRE